VLAAENGFSMEMNVVGDEDEVNNHFAKMRK